MTALFKKVIPWQDRERLGGIAAFVMTTIEALISPVEYYGKLTVSNFYQEPLILCFFNSLHLAVPLMWRIYSWVSFLAVIFILIVSPAALFLLAFVVTKIFSFFGEKTDYIKSFYVLAYTSPAFVFAYIPDVGYGLAAVAVVILASIGLVQIHRVRFIKVLPVLVIVPFLVFVPYGAVRYAKYWEMAHPLVDNEVEAQKVLMVLSAAAEGYADNHSGNYPTESKILSMPPQQYLKRDYCGVTLNDYYFDCEFRNYGYLLKAKPQGWKSRWEKTFYMTTGGKLSEE